MLLRYSTIIGLLVCYAGHANGDSERFSEVAYKCAIAAAKTCNVLFIKLETPTQQFKLVDVGDKKVLNIKGGSIEALRTTHCTALVSFEKITIGRVGLKELCIATSFVQVTAEHNRIRTLHVPTPEDTTYRLEVLRLNDNELESVESMQPFEALRELYLERNSLSTLDMTCFAGMSKLKKLYLASNRLNTIASTLTELSLPALSFVGLQNNTLIELDLHTWSLPELEQLQLSFNNLTKVRGLDSLETLSEISLAGNRWHCHELELMLEVLERNGVTVNDGDTNCIAIRNGTICCTHVEQPTETTLLTELEKFTLLDHRYNESMASFDKTVQDAVAQFKAKLKELTEAADKNKKEGMEITTTTPSESGDDGDGAAKESTEKDESVCSKESIQQMETRLSELKEKIDKNSVMLKGLQNSQAQFSYMTVLAKHEFRTAVKRGEGKLRELSSMLAMLREHVEQKKQSEVK
uniref:Leucine rich immune protein (Short) n=1 Tax=Anopheles epiroticus TaxID=199890 RepID=A0A182PQG7_9DIPT